MYDLFGNFFNHSEKPDELKTYFAAIYQFDSKLNHHGFTILGNLYTNFKQGFNKYIKENKLLKFKHIAYYSEVIIHNSLLIQCFPYNHVTGFSANFSDIFALKYLNKKLTDYKMRSESKWEERYYANQGI